MEELHGSLSSDSKSRSRKWDFRERTTGFLIFSNKHCLEPTIRPISAGPNERNKHRHLPWKGQPVEFLDPLYPQGRNSKTRLQRGRPRGSRTYVKANGQRRSESRRVEGYRVFFEGELVVARSRINKGLLFFPVFIHDCRRYRRHRRGRYRYPNVVCFMVFYLQRGREMKQQEIPTNSLEE